MSSRAGHGKSRTDAVNPLHRVSFRDRLASAGAIDLENNSQSVSLPSGFVVVIPKDPTKKIGQARKRAK
jgi:hypothetical protein